MRPIIRMALPGPVLCSHARRNEQGAGLPINICCMPASGRIDCKFSGPKHHLVCSPICKFSGERHRTAEANNNFIANGVHFPAVPAFRKRICRNQPTIFAICRGVSGIGFIPIHARHRAKDQSRAALSKMKRHGKYGLRGNQSPVCILAFTLALPLFLPFFGGAGVISNASALSFKWMLTSPPFTSLPNSNSSANGCLIFS